MADIVAQLNKVSLSYGGAAPVFSDVSLQLEKGSFHFLTGASGSGKTSLLKLLYLQMKPTSGKIRLFERDVSEMAYHDMPFFRQRIGNVFQEFKLLDHITILDNVALPLLVRGVSVKKSHEHAAELLSWVGLSNYLTWHPPSLSGGQKQRVAIARAIITRPQLLLADEPTGNVDDQIALRLLHLFEELNKIGTAIVIATHNTSLIQEFPYPELYIKNSTLNIKRPALLRPVQEVVA